MAKFSNIPSSADDSVVVKRRSRRTLKDKNEDANFDREVSAEDSLTFVEKKVGLLQKFRTKLKNVENVDFSKTVDSEDESIAINMRRKHNLDIYGVELCPDFSAVVTSAESSLQNSDTHLSESVNCSSTSSLPVSQQSESSKNVSEESSKYASEESLNVDEENSENISEEDSKNVSVEDSKNDSVKDSKNVSEENCNVSEECELLDGNEAEEVSRHSGASSRTVPDSPNEDKNLSITLLNSSENQVDKIDTESTLTENQSNENEMEKDVTPNLSTAQSPGKIDSDCHLRDI